MNNRYSIDRDPTVVGEACTIFRYLVGKLVNVFHRGWKVITTKPRTLGRTLECGFKIPPPGQVSMELVGGSWESINSPYRKTLRVQYAEKSASREFARNYDPPFSLSSSSQFQIFPRATLPTHFLNPLPLSSFIPLLIFLSPLPPPDSFSHLFSLPIPHIFSPPLSNFHLSNSSITAILPNLFAFFPPSRRKNVDGASKDRSPRGNRMSNIFAEAGGQLGIQVSVRIRE